MTTTKPLAPVIDIRMPPAEARLDFERLPLAVLVVTPPDLVADTNGGWSRLTGLSRDRSVGHGWLECVYADDLAVLRRSLLEEASGTHDVRLLCIPAQGAPAVRWTRWQWIEDPAGGHKVVAVVDVHADRARELKLSERATHDPLTGVLNRSQFLDTLARRVADLDGDSALAVLFVDLDRFKEVNDTGGHHVGDAVLGRVAQRLERALRPGDVLGRLGGDEFGVICTGLPNPPDTGPLIERVQAAFHEPFDVLGGLWPVAASVGVAVTRSSTTAPASLVQEADACMYAARRSQEPDRSPADLPQPHAVPVGATHPAMLARLDALRAVLEHAVRRDGLERERLLVEALGRLDSLIACSHTPARDPDTVSDVVTEARDALLDAAGLLTQLWAASLSGDGPMTNDAARLGVAARQVRAALVALGPQVVM